MAALPLVAALKRGALITAANWPVVIIDFVLESFYKLAVTIPVLGGALMVGAIVGTDVEAVIGEGVRAAADVVMGSLATAPIALVAFLLALALVGLGGEAIMFAIKAGTLSVIVESERVAGELQATPISTDALRDAHVYSLTRVYDGTRRFGRRGFVLALWLGAAYVVIAAVYLTIMGYSYSVAVRHVWMPAWPLIVLIATTGAVVAVSAINLAFDLVRVILISDDCGLSEAARRLRHFVIEDARQVIGIFSVVGVVVVIATAASLLAAAGIAFVAWVPFVGLIVLPLQAAAWIVRGIVFQYLAVAALSAYQTQYRRFSEPRRPLRA